MNIVTKEEARSSGAKLYFTGVPCKYGHLCERRLSTLTCVLCAKLMNEKYRSSKKGQVTNKRNRQSSHTKAADKKYQKTDKAKAYHKSLAKDRFASGITTELTLNRSYGITTQQRDDMIEAQSYKCKICHTQFEGKGRAQFAPCIDHCHITGVVRGILCNRCNVGLGWFKDSTDNLLSAIEYLNQIPP